MPANICIFEDTQYDRLLPLVYTRPVYKLRCGMHSLQEKIARRYPEAQLSLHCRPYLADTWRVRNPRSDYNTLSAGEYLFINGRVLASRGFEKLVPLKSKGDIVYIQGETVIAAHVSGAKMKRLQERLQKPLSLGDFDGIPRREIKVEIISYPWDLVHRNGKEIENDFKEIVSGSKRNRVKGTLYKDVQILNKSNVLIEAGAGIKPGTVLDAESGPIYIGKNVRIFPQSTLIGPLSISEGSWVKVGAQLYENTTIGPMCKIGGEVEASIFQGYSNKQHAGFIGHSYIGSWVNLGAGTNNSDLKNNYGKVRVQFGSEQIDTGMQFVGLTMGDHSKSSINSMFNTGTIVGVSSNIFGNGFPAKFVPSFIWGAVGAKNAVYNVDKALEVARRVMGRRNIEMTSAEEKLFETIFEMTSEERKRSGV